MNTQEAIEILERDAPNYADFLIVRDYDDAVLKYRQAITHAIEYMKRGQKRDHSIVEWFKNESIDDPLLKEFILNTDFDYFKKAGRDKNGRYNIFLVKDDKSIAAICSNSEKLHVHALKLLTEPPQERKD